MTNGLLLRELTLRLLANGFHRVFGARSEHLIVFYGLRFFYIRIRIREGSAGLQLNTSRSDEVNVTQLLCATATFQ